MGLQHQSLPLCWRAAFLLLLLVLGSCVAVANNQADIVPVDEIGNHMFRASFRVQQQRQTQQEISMTTALQTNSNERATFEKNNDFLGIPGTTQTKNGYDTALGDDPICWVGKAVELAGNKTVANATISTSAVDQLVKTVFPNPLVENFTLLGKTEILDECPQGNTVIIQKPEESLRGERLRTLQYYNYTLHVEIDLDTLDGDYIVADDGTATIALQVVVCSLGKSGFCSPFVHEQANAREAIDKANSGAEIVETKKKVSGDLHGGTHIHSPWFYFDIGSEKKLNTSVMVPMIVNHPGDYFVIGTVQLYTGINGSNAYRWDIANALEAGDGRYVIYQAPPDIREVSDGVLYFSYAAIAIAGLVILFLTGQTIWHRDHQVLLLSQGDFLIVFLFSALMATCCSFLLAPKNDIYCRINYPLLVMPIQLMYAITVGRMWRIHAVISPLLLEHLSKGRPGLTQRFVQAITYVSFTLHDMFVWRKEDVRRGTMGGPKQQISQFQLALVVALFTLPQVVVQLVAVFVQPGRRQVIFNEDESIGRATCSSDVAIAGNFVMYSFIMLILLIIILLVMAHSSRKLPSLFNETHVIYDSTFLSMALLLLGGAVILLTNSPSTSPDVQYLVSLVLVLSITLNSAVRIMLPKLKMVWKNETIIVSKLVTDHHRKAREKAGKNTTMHGVSGLDPSDSRLQGSSFQGGDYDLTQQNRLLRETFHSTSNDTGLAYGRSYVGSSEGASENPLQASMRSCNDDDSGVRTDGPLLEKLEPEPYTIPEEDEPSADLEKRRSGDSRKSLQKRAADQTSSTDLDVESGESVSAPGEMLTHHSEFDKETSQEMMAAVCNAKLEEHPDDCKRSDGHLTDGGTTDDEDDIEAAVAAASMFGTPGVEKVKKVSFFEQHANGFLKNAMAKGMSWRVTDKHQGHEDLNVGSSRGFEKDVAQEHHETHQEQKKRRKKCLADRIIVTEDETPARRLVLKMLDLQDHLESVNNKIMSGLAVTQEDWAVITKLTSRLDRTFNEEVEFQWDLERRYEESLKNVMPADMAGSHDTPKKDHHHHHDRSSNASKEKASCKSDEVTADEKLSTKKDRRLQGILRGPHKQDDETASRSSGHIAPPPTPTNKIAPSFAPTAEATNRQDSIFSDEGADAGHPKEKKTYFV